MPRPIPDLPVGERRTDPRVELGPEDLHRQLDLPTLFGNDRPVELEIGVGKGRFVMLAAAARPDTNFLGLEVAKRFLAKAIDRVAKRGLNNVRLIQAEAAAFLSQCLAESSIEGIHLYFPDPWPKKRHHKRRIVRPAVLDEMHRVLWGGGLVRVVTDHADYAAAMRETFGRHPSFEEAPNDPGLWEIPGMGDYTEPGVTNFEIKFRREGRPIHRMAWRNRP
jgi:tRNA (guanine-N7-)-methyltransferase